MENKNINFVARYYRRGSFSVNSAWHSLGIARTSWWWRDRAVAAATGLVILSATAAVLYKNYNYETKPQPVAPEIVLNTMAEVKIIDFEKTPLPLVVEQIETVYSVRVDGLPENADAYVLSLHYEGTPAELIDIINGILGTKLTVREK